MSFCFIHAADLHLDTPFDGIGRAEPDVARALRDASLEAFDRLIELALEQEAVFVVFAGDIYDEGERGIRAQIAFKEGVRRLGSAGIWSFIVHGNHDPLASRWAKTRQEWPDLTHIFEPDTPVSVEVEREGQVIAVVHGVSFAQRKEERNLAKLFPKAEGDVFQVGVLHCNVGGIEGHDPYAGCEIGDLRKQDYDYWALGHIHSQKFLQKGDPWIVYPGNLQGRSPKPAEQGSKGALVVEVDGRKVVDEPKFVALDGIRFASLSVDIAPFADTPDLQHHLQEEAARLTDEADGRSLLVRVELQGHGQVHEDLRRPDALTELCEGLRDHAPAGASFVWWESVRDATRPELDLDAIEKRGDFLAEVLLLSKELQASPDTAPEALGVTFPSAADPEMLEEAALMAVELLAGDGE